MESPRFPIRRNVAPLSAAVAANVFPIMGAPAFWIANNQLEVAR